MKTNRLIWLVATFLAWLIFRPIIAPGAWYPMHDSTHPARIILMQWTILGGQFPPIWADVINGGYGYPLFHFYAPLYHLFSTLVGFAGFLPTTALKLSLFLTLTLGLSGIMFFARRWGRVAMLVAGTALAFSPFIALELYVRGAYSELLSLCLLPWVLLATEDLSTKKKVAQGSIAITLLVLSHNLIPLLALPMILVWMIYQNRGKLSHVAWATMLGVALSAWFILPLLFERHFTVADEVARTTNYSLHYVEPWQMWNSTWGFGGSAEGVEDGMSFKLGKLLIILGSLGLLFAVIQKRSSLILIGLFTLLSVFLATSYARLVWDSLPLLQIVQFPWRTLGLVIIFLSLLSGFAVSRIPTRPLRVLTALLVVTMFWRIGNQYFQPQEIISTSFDSEQFSSDDMPDIVSVIPEYMPIWLHKENLQPQNTVSPSTFWASEQIVSIDTDGVEGWIPGGYTYEFSNNGKESSVSVGLAYYPIWKAYLNGELVKVNPDENGLVSIAIPPGEYKLELRQSHTSLEYFSYALTLLAIGYTIGLLKEQA